MSTEQNEIRLPVPPRIYAKLKEIAGYRSVEQWVQDVLARAAEEAQPSLSGSGMWRMHVSEWWSLVNKDDGEGEAELIADGILTEGQVAVRRANEGWGR